MRNLNHFCISSFVRPSVRDENKDTTTSNSNSNIVLKIIIATAT